MRNGVIDRVIEVKKDESANKQRKLWPFTEVKRKPEALKTVIYDIPYVS